MADGSTPNYGWTLPEVGASADSWGAKTNDNWSSVDTDLYNVSALFGNYLLLTGGTLSGGLAVAGWGINYSGSVHWLAFGWDGSFPTYSVDGGSATGELASTAWVNGNFKLVSAYTPNQNVDYNSNPTFFNPIVGGTFYAQNSAANHQFSNGTFAGTLNVGSTLNVGNNLQVNGSATANGNISAGAAVFVGSGSGVVYSALGGNGFAFNWDGYLQSYVNGGYQGHIPLSPPGSPYTVAQIYVDGGHNALLVQLDGSYHYVHTTYSSDRRLKSNIRPANIDALALINSIPVYECDIRYPGPDDRTTHWEAAVIADELEKFIPHAVVYPEPVEGERGYAGISELPLVTMLLRAVQQLSAEVTMLKQSRA